MHGPSQLCLAFALAVAGISAGGTRPVDAVLPVHLGLVPVELVTLVRGVSAGRVGSIDVKALEVAVLGGAGDEGLGCR